MAVLRSAQLVERHPERAHDARVEASRRIDRAGRAGERQPQIGDVFAGRGALESGQVDADEALRHERSRRLLERLARCAFGG